MATLNKTDAAMDIDSAGDCIAHSECSPTAVEIDPRGDLTLLVGRTSCRSSSTGQLKPPVALPPKPVAFRVCSRTMARAARVFDVMLYGKFAEARQPDSRWTVRLPDDNPEAMAKLLPVMHGRFDDFDSCLDIGGLGILYHITVITDKYDLTHILRPWAGKLVRNLKSYALASSLDPGTLWVSWVLGTSVTFKSIMTRLAWETEHPGPLIIHDPPGACDKIRAMRQELIDDLMRPLTSTVTALTARNLPDKVGLQCKKGGGATSVCNLFTLASLIQSLHSLNLWPLPDSATWVHSASQLEETFRKLRIQRDANHRPALLQPGCAESVVSGGRVCWYPEVSATLTDEQLNHLKRQAEKMGLKADC